MRILNIGIIAVMVAITANLFGQDCEVKGTITDQDSHRIPGANILIKGTPGGVVANATGDFLLRLPFGKTPLQFAFVGFKTIQKNFSFNKDSSYVLEVKMVQKGDIGRGSVTITSRSLITSK